MKETCLESESGSFFVDEKGYIQRFEPSEDNPFLDDVSDYQKTKISKSIRTLIIPEGVKGFVSDFMRGVRVIERFELPEGLVSIGNNSFDVNTGVSCVFANCVLPTVKLPDSLQEIGDFAFGHTHIEALYIPEGLKSPYGRQFKDSGIGTLYLPKAWEGDAHLGQYGGLRASFITYGEDWGYLCWPSTKIGELKFY